MNKYFSTVRIKGHTVRTMVFADSPLHARLILEFQFGIGNVVGTPIQSNGTCETYTPLSSITEMIKPKTPQQARIDSLKKQKELISKNLETERNRQKVTKAKQQIKMATTKIV
jgi:hypothetical protein